jgi:alpha-1,3-rhamnosyl/mannosyltransferase
MRVLINGLSMTGARSGIGHYTAELHRSLIDQGHADEVTCFPAPGLRRALGVWARIRPMLVPSKGEPAAGRGEVVSGERPLVGGLRALGRTLLARHFRAACRRGRFDLYHEPNFIPLPCDLPTVTTLHDLGVLLHPEWHPVDRIAAYERDFGRALKQSVHIVTVSDFGRREVIDALGLAPERVSRIYQGIRPNLRPMPRPDVHRALTLLGLPLRYLLYVGTLEPRKNLLTLVQAYCGLPGEVREAYPLLLVGGWGWKSGELANYLASEARDKNVRHIGYLPEEHLGAVYNGARALVFPSLYEGFGLPPLEMMACGGAVVASTADALKETVGGHAHFVEPHDLDGWRDALLRVTCDDDWWHQLRRGAEQVARPFTWERCAAETLTLYRTLAKGTTPPGTALRKAG